MSDEIRKQEFDPAVRNRVVADAVANDGSITMALKGLWEVMEKPEQLLEAPDEYWAETPRVLMDEDPTGDE
ncbi:hypothetical protein LCGC14_0933840 [marine sediment metagenome]|uniref:Uncharacterized protein n=1 Tax=marine sediment metagenome TaxID=412755 RepID=A0A0F9NRP1_9ZZZZ